MKNYNLLDKEQINHYIVLPKYICWVFFIITMILLVCTVVINKALGYVFWIFLGITFIFICLYIYNCKVYGKKVCISDGVIVLYTYRGKMISIFKISECSQQKCIVMFYYPKNVCKKIECLVLLCSAEIQENMEYRSYWNKKDMLIISNPILIQIIESAS